MNATLTTTRRKLADNLRRVRQRIAEAALRSVRRPEDIELVVVTKSVGVDVIRMLLEMGEVKLGESRVQELVKRAAMVHEGLSRRSFVTSEPALPRPSWHLVGHLQRNKVRGVLPWVDLIHSVDSLRLAEEIDSQSEKLTRRVPVLLQVNTADEPGKYGVAVGAAAHLAEQFLSLPRVELQGLMAMAPLGAEPRRLESALRRAAELFEEMRRSGIWGPTFQHLSMGMSDDFEAAVEHGATMVRLGRAVFAGILPEGSDRDEDDSTPEASSADR